MQKPYFNYLLLVATVRNRMVSERLRQRDVARLTGMDKAAVSRFLRGIGQPSLQHVVLMLSWLDCDTNQFFPHGRRAGDPWELVAQGLTRLALPPEVYDIVYRLLRYYVVTQAEGQENEDATGVTSSSGTRGV